MLNHRSRLARLFSAAAACAALSLPAIFVIPAAGALRRDPDPAAKPANPQRAAVEAVLASMKAAVLAGDAQAYLRHVVPGDGPLGDPIFRKEQENWASDLKDHVPTEFEALISDHEGREPSFTDTRAEIELIIRWKMPEDPNRPSRTQKVRELSYPALLVRAADGVGGEGGKSGGWLFAGERWVTIEGDAQANVVARCMEGYEKHAGDAVAVFPDVRSHVEQVFDIKVGHRQEIKIYPTMRHLQESIYLSYVDPLSGWNEPGESIKVLGERRAGTAGSKRSIKGLLGHEFGHCATFEMGPKMNDAPWWVLEGAAELASAGLRPGLWNSTERMVRRWGKGQGPGLAEWKDITNFRTTAENWQQHVYYQGHHIIGWLSKKHGDDKRNAWLREMASGKSLDDATKAALGMSFEELDAAWRADLKAVPDDPTAAPPAEKPAPTDEKPKEDKPG